MSKRNVLSGITALALGVAGLVFGSYKSEMKQFEQAVNQVNSASSFISREDAIRASQELLPAQNYISAVETFLRDQNTDGPFWVKPKDLSNLTAKAESVRRGIEKYDDSTAKDMLRFQENFTEKRNPYHTK